MREFIQATARSGTAWETGEPLQFRGEFYTHTLMTPFFTPPEPTPASARRRSSSPASAR